MQYEWKCAGVRWSGGNRCRKEISVADFLGDTDIVGVESDTADETSGSNMQSGSMWMNE
jgi:hypothetical protein